MNKLKVINSVQEMEINMKLQTYKYLDKSNDVALEFGFPDDENISRKKRAFMELMKQAVMDLQVELPVIKDK